MSFAAARSKATKTEKQPQTQEQPTKTTRFQAPVPPPAAAPPPPPHSSFQDSMGDIDILPNTGETNADSCWGTLAENKTRLRIFNFALLFLTLSRQLWAVLGKLFLGHLAKAVLGVYLGLACLVMASVELSTCCNLGIHPVVLDNLGIVYHPLGKAACWAFLGGLCGGQATSRYEWILALGFFVSSAWTAKVYWHFAEWQREGWSLWHPNNRRSQTTTAPTVSWSSLPSERTSLLSSNEPF